MPTNTCTSAAYYEDPAAALDWLERAFGFETTMRITDDAGHVVHAEMEAEGNRIMVGPGGWSDFAKSPKTLGGANTQSIHVGVTNLDAHYARATKAGATIVAEPAEQFYGSKTYRASDPEGHVWSFGQEIRDVPLKEAGKAMGLKVELRREK
jgi:uncharacterized glyoxalase superfamily protein PhnB